MVLERFRKMLADCRLLLPARFRARPPEIFHLDGGYRIERTRSTNDGGYQVYGSALYKDGVKVLYQAALADEERGPIDTFQRYLDILRGEAEKEDEYRNYLRYSSDEKRA